MNRRLTLRCTGRQPLRGYPESYTLGVRLAPVSAEPLGGASERYGKRLVRSWNIRRWKVAL